jgi:hypothetical protein
VPAHAARLFLSLPQFLGRCAVTSTAWISTLCIAGLLNFDIFPADLAGDLLLVFNFGLARPNFFA